MANLSSKMKVPVSGAVLGVEESEAIRKIADKMWLTAGKKAHMFEDELAEVTGTKYGLLTNSGSSANLLALATLMQPEIPDHLKPGDKVATLAAGFPTTINPIVQLGLRPVFVDIDLHTLNVDMNSLLMAVNMGVKAVILPHTLGNPFDVLEVRVELAESKTDYVWLIEDCCDALGSTDRGAHVGDYGDLATYSFFPAHQITMGEGGGITTNDMKLYEVASSLRDWGRDCICDPGQSGVCGKRFCGKYGELPEGYDHKYIYIHIGYNLRGTELGAAIGLEQLKKLKGFVEKRRHNWSRLHDGLLGLKGFKYASHALGVEPSWFGFSILCCGPDRGLVTAYLNYHGVDTRYLFAGNITKQPAYAKVDYEIAPSGLPNTDRVMKDLFWVGVWPGLNDEHIDYIIETMHKGVKENWRLMK
jgi:CDP-6-deoxy-D-xylo-4-hexulose-3-dehydrase